MTHERRQPTGPINGRIGWLLSASKQAAPFFWMFMAIAFSVGFKFTTPAQDIADMKERMKRVEQVTEALLRIRCAEIGERDAQLANLVCKVQ